MQRIPKYMHLDVEKRFLEKLQAFIETPYASDSSLPLMFFVIDILTQRVDELEVALNDIAATEEETLRAIVQDELDRMGLAL